MTPPQLGVDDIRRHFADTKADALREQIGPKFSRIPEQSGWTRRAVWYEGEQALMAVVGKQEGGDTDRVLAHGLYLAKGRQLRLVLPADFANPSRVRQPWLTADIDIWTHADGLVSHPTPLVKAETSAGAGGHETKRAYTLGSRASGWVRDLIEWATQHPDLAEAHTSSLRGWSHNGQRVLTIKGKRHVVIKAGIDAKAEAAATYALDSALMATTLAEVRKHVERGIKNARAKEYGKFEEHHLQVVLRQSPGTLLLEHPVLREVPAWRPAGGTKTHGRGFIDLVGMDGSGDVVLVETKLDSDEMLILQGLDYWIWASNPDNNAWLRERLYADPKAQTHLLYAVAGKGGRRPKLGQYEIAHLQYLDLEIPWRVALLREWNDHDAPKVEMLDPLEIPR